MPDKSQNIDHNHVLFGRKLVINPNMRLKQFDNGNAFAYQAYDVSDKSKSYIALISGVENIPRWNDVSSYNKLGDTSFMRLFGSGIVNWKPEGCQKYAFIYVNTLGVDLAQGGLSDSGWRHPDIIEYFIQPIASMFREMRDRSFAHGSVRLSNMFYSSTSKAAPIILGDGLSICAGSSQPSLYLPISKSLTEEMGRGNPCIEDDIYAFGISLFIFLSKGSDLLSLDDNEVFHKKMEMGSFSALIGAERFPVTFLELLRGVLHDDQKLRWGVKEIFLWLDGTRATPSSPVKRSKANRPMLFSGNKYLFAEIFAIDMHENPREISSMVDDGSLEQWITKSIDNSDLTERYFKALERVASIGDVKNNMDYLVAQLRIAFCPELPIYYKNRCFFYSGLGSMMVKSICDGEKLSFYKEVIDLNLLDHALVSDDLSQSAMIAALKSFDVCRASASQVKYGFGIEKCIYMMCENAACLSPKFDGYFVNSGKSLLNAFEKICQGGNGDPFVMDMHLTAFFSVFDSRLVEGSLFDLNSGDKGKNILSNLKILSVMQKRSGDALYPSIAGVFEKSLSGAYKLFKNIKMRGTVEGKVKSAAENGDLSKMVEVLSDQKALTLDGKGFQIAAYEYKNLHDEYNEYNKRLEHKKSYGVVNGHNVAVSVSWVISVALTIIVVISFLSGNQIF